jgi:hypothetical protein
MSEPDCRQQAYAEEQHDYELRKDRDELDRLQRELAELQAVHAVVCKEVHDGELNECRLERELAEAREGIREVMDDHATTLERLDECHRLLRLSIDSLRRDGRPHVVTMVQVALGDIVATAPPVCPICDYTAHEGACVYEPPAKEGER